MKIDAGEWIFQISTKGEHTLLLEKGASEVPREESSIREDLLRKHEDILRAAGIDLRKLRRLEKAYCTLVDNERAVKLALERVVSGGSERDFANVCAAIRWLLDGEE